MESGHDHIKLTSGEIASLWSSYLNDSVSICTISYFLKDVEDPETRSLLEYSMGLSKQHIQTLNNLFKSENFPIPMAFTEQDVNLNAARLFEDTFMLFYIHIMSCMGITNYGLALPNSARKDIREYFKKCMNDAMDTYDQATEIMQEKGLYVRYPFIPYPSQVEFIHKEHFLAGWIGDQRPLTSIEISYLFANLFRNVLGASLLTGFSQVTQSKEVRHYMERGIEIAKHHSAVFHKFLVECSIPTPMTWDTMPTTSTESPFSEKLMMYYSAALCGASIGYYGFSMGLSPRRDLAAAYARLIAEVGEYAADGSQIMINNGWLEKPPSAPNRKDLARG